MSDEYSVEEVRALAGDYLDASIVAEMLNDYADLLERIKADEGADGRIDFNGMWNDMSATRPPAQAAQVDKPPKFGGCCCGEPCVLGTVHRTDGPCFVYDAPAAEPVAQGEAGVIVKDTVCFGNEHWYRRYLVQGVTFLAPLDDQANALHVLSLAAQPRAVPADALNILRRSRDDDNLNPVYRQAMRDAVAQLETWTMLAAAPSPGESNTTAQDVDHG